jgi:uncharacterized repeat protein (TIGR01451 family)
MMRTPSFPTAPVWRRRCANIVRPLAAAVPGAWTALSLLMLAGLVSTAAQAGQVACTPSTGYTNCTRITYSGADQSFTVPANVTLVNIKAWGGGGGGASLAYYANQYGGGGGGFAEGTLAVTGGSTLGVRVGGGGRIDDTVGVYGGGGAGGTGQATANGGSGGGLSGVFVGTYTQANARVIAGGGGGSSPGGDVGTPGGGGGGGGGLNGGTLGGAASGQGGTAAAGGAAATGGGCNLSAPTAGSALQGGTGGRTNTNQMEGGGGGGGGYFGGGGGRCQGTQTNGMGGGGSGRLNGVTGGTGTTGANASANGAGGAAANTADAVYSAGIGAGGGYGAGGNGEVVIQWVSPRVQITKTTLAGTTGSNNFSFTHTGLKTLAGAAADNSTVSVTAAATVAGVNHVGAAGVAQTITETPPSGFRTNSIQCVDANSAATGNTNPVASSVTVGTSTITIPAAAMDAGSTPALSAAITCTFTNEQVLAPTLSKTFSPATILEGGTSVLTITLANTVSTAATLSAALTDTLPAGVTVAATPGASTTCTGSGAVVAVAGAGSVSLPATRTIPAGTPGGAAGSCTVTVNVTSSTAGTVTNTLAAGALQTNYGNNAAAASANLTVTSVILGLVKSAPSPALQVGSNSAYTLTVTNTGTATTTTARVVDQLPANMTYVSGTGTGWTCSAAAGLVTCNYSGSIAAGGGASVITITATPTSTASVTNYASVDRTGGTNTPTPTTCTAANTPTAGCAAPVTSTPTSVILGLVKSAPSPALQVLSNSAYTLTVTNSGTAASPTARVLDQLPSTLSYVSGVGTGWTCSTAPSGGGTLVTCNYSGNIAAGGGTAALVITVTSTSNAAVTNYASVDPTGGTAPPVPTTCTAANAPSAGCAAPVSSTAGRLVAGNVYSDANHNSNLDAGEAGPGGAIALFVKLVPLSGSVCTGPATAAASVNLSTGAYSLPSVAEGSYCLILDGNGTLADITAGYPAGWIGTQNPSGEIQLAVGAAPPSPQNFGLYNGSTLSGNVFADNGAGGGTANNGVKAGTEPGLAGITVNAMQGATTVDSQPTASDGSFILWIPGATSGTVTLTPVLPSGYAATGGSAGTTGGSYTRPSVSYTAGSGLARTGISFGMVAPNTLSPNGAQTAQPGTVVFYAHSYKAATGGSVTFSMANTATPASPAWNQVLYQDSNCNAALEASETQVTTAITVTAGQTVCLVIKQFVPAGAGLGAQNSITLSAAFTYTNSAPALAVSTLLATDITTVGQAGDLSLAKLVSNVTQAIAAATSVNANPGDTLQYTLTATNNGTQPLSTLFVSDSTAAFTGFVSATCPGALPAGITACTVTTQPAVNAQGALKWTFTGSLASGGQLVVTYRVKVDQ